MTKSIQGGFFYPTNLLGSYFNTNPLIKTAVSTFATFVIRHVVNNTPFRGFISSSNLMSKFVVDSNISPSLSKVVSQVSRSSFKNSANSYARLDSSSVKASDFLSSSLNDLSAGDPQLGQQNAQGEFLNSIPSTIDAAIPVILLNNSLDDNKASASGSDSTWPKFFLPVLSIIPILTKLFSVERVLKNVDVQITRPSNATLYRIILGDGEGFDEISFKISGSGTLIISPEEAENERCDPTFDLNGLIRLNAQLKNFVKFVFKATASSLSNPTEMLNLLMKYLMSPEVYTECIVYINNPGNWELRKAPKVHTIFLSNYRTLTLVHRDPNVTKDPIDGNEAEGDSDEWDELSKTIVEVSDLLPQQKCRKANFLLHPDKNDEFFKIIQLRLARGDNGRR